MAKVPVAPVGGESGGVVCGKYDGNGAAERTVVLGFTPRAVFVLREDGSTRRDDICYGGLALEGDPCKSGNYLIVSICANGFLVFEQDTSGRDYVKSNGAGDHYRYIAFR